MDCDKLAKCIEKHTPEKIAFVRVETGTNLIGGQPHSLQNLKDVKQVWQHSPCALLFFVPCLCPRGLIVDVFVPVCVPWG